jgi:phosphotransferase system HPr (HPr) family protein
MKRSQVAIAWREGLHLRRAAKVVDIARAFQSSVSLRIGQRVADARSIIAILLLCGTVGSVVDVEVSGADEDQALAAITSVFESTDSDVGDTGGGADDRGESAV